MTTVEIVEHRLTPETCTHPHIGVQSPIAFVDMTAQVVKDLDNTIHDKNHVRRRAGYAVVRAARLYTGDEDDNLSSTLLDVVDVGLHLVIQLPPGIDKDKVALADVLLLQADITVLLDAADDTFYTVLDITDGLGERQHDLDRTLEEAEVVLVVKRLKN